MRSLFIALSACALSACGGPSRFVRGNLEVLAFRHDSTNAYLVSQNGSLLLIDSGYEKNALKLERDIRDAGFDPARVRTIILTHGHADHAGGARHFQSAFGARLVAGSGDRAMLAGGKNEPLCPTGFLGRLRRSTDQNARFTSTVADRWIDQATPLAPLAGIDGWIVPVPGHTSGSLVVLIGELAFVGDLLRGAIGGSGAATHLYMCDVEANRRDVAQLLDGSQLANGQQLANGSQLANQPTTFFVGHFGPAVPREAVIHHFQKKR